MFAGSYTKGNTGDGGPATAARMSGPVDVVSDVARGKLLLLITDPDVMIRYSMHQQ